MKEVQLNSSINSIFSSLDHLDALSIARSSNKAEGFGYLDGDLGKAGIFSRFSKEDLLPFLVQIPTPGGVLKVLWWLHKRHVDHDVLEDKKCGFLELIPVEVFFDFSSFSEHENNQRTMVRAVGSLLFLLKGKPLRALLELDPREWEAFLRQKNSESLEDFLKRHTNAEKKLSLTEIHQELREFKWALLLELASKFLHYQKGFFQNRRQPFSFLADNYQTQNLAFSQWSDDLLSFFGPSLMVFSAVEAQKIAGQWCYQIAKRPGLSAENSLFYKAILGEKKMNSHVFPMKLVAVE